MNNINDYLPLYTLNQLADSVAIRILYFKQFFSPENIWNGIIEPCQKVEEEPRNVNTIIIEARKDNVLLIRGAGVIKYHLKTTLIYILLYYRHRDDKIYQAIVFPELIRNMGVFGSSKILKESIQEEIDKIIEHDKLVEQATTKTEVVSSVVTPEIPKEEILGQEQPLKETIPSESIGFHDKVRLDLLLRLMESNGADLDKYGNKVKAAQVMQSITGLPLQTCKNYCTERNLNVTTHSEEVLQMNTLLQALGMEIRL